MQTPLIHWRDPGRAVALLTRLPVRTDGARGAAAAWAWPLVGLAAGGIAAMAAVTALSLGLPASVAAGLCLMASILVTGALHEDGLADCADGVWGGWTRERRLEILKDSRIGAYGVIALILGIGLRWSLLTSFFASGAVFGPVLAAAMLSRGAMAGVMAALPFARGDGLARHVGRPSASTAALAAGLALGAASLMVGWGGLLAALAALAAAVAVARIAQAKLGGQTGDVLGATQQITEIAALIALAAWAAG